ncbi:hypothetical protein CBQ26_19880 [Deinococcus indicus]|uniref:Uncharacterized protein n=1 Tax=Deinococcus indicus TaxID=223556 RepID=A0A246BE55_9DEIO|nr:hypothetical protein [Deinococcus indicus]OWL93489.1 hypothetical protein CBQ26_19880 [Deinococcus indicus]
MTSTRTAKHHTDRPDFTAALRSAAWTYRHRQEPFAPKDIQAAVQQARRDMGLPPYRGGAVSDYLQRRTKGTALQKQDNQPVHYLSVDRKLRPAPTVMSNWRFLEAADHAVIRLTAFQGLLSKVQDGQYTFSTRGSHLPSLTVLVGEMAEVRRQVDSDPAFKARRGLYLLRRNGRNYAGQTREFSTRGRSHTATGAEFVIFAFPDEQETVSGDVLNVAESLTIASLSELLDLENGNLGSDETPRPQNLREGSAFATAFLAAVFRSAQQELPAGPPFLVWRTDVRGLAEAYLTLQPYQAPEPVTP